MIRPALEADIAAIVRLNADVLALHTENAPWAYHCPKTDAEPVAWFSAILKEPATRFWVEVDEGNVVRGYLFAKEIISEATWMRPAQHYLMLEHIVVSPDHRRCGLGHGLLTEFLAEAKRLGVERIGLFTWSFNRGAQLFFQRYGFKAVLQRMEKSVG